MRHFWSAVLPDKSQNGFTGDSLHANAFQLQGASKAHRARMRFEGRLVLGLMAVLYAAWIGAISTGLMDRLSQPGGGF